MSHIYTGRIIYLTIMIVFFLNSQLFPQALSRSTGMGFRLGFSKPGSDYLEFDVSGYSEDVQIETNELNLWANYYSRMQKNWFLEVNAGLLFSENERYGFVNNVYIEPSPVVALFVGARYEWITDKLPADLQPYIMAGIGPYWVPDLSLKNSATGMEIKRQSAFDLGSFIGIGTHVKLNESFILNIDLKNHRFDMEDNLLNPDILTSINQLELGIGLTFNWGRKRPIFEIERTQVILKDIYPAYYNFYRSFPLALVTVKNTTSYPIEVNLRTSVPPFTTRPTESGYQRIERGQKEEIPATVYFGNSLKGVSEREPVVLEIEVSGRSGDTYTTETNSEITIHHRNAWNGEMDKLVFFITPYDHRLLEISRGIANSISDTVYSSPLVKFEQAKFIFENLKDWGIKYQVDPNVPFYKDDRVQYPVETLNLKSGDCDDLVILYASLLESLGISTAFVEVRDVDKPVAHLYLMFDTGIDPLFGGLITSNEKRFVVRVNEFGKTSIWIPVETTLLQSGFEEAWKAASLQYLEEGILRNGIIEDWVRIINVE